MVNDVSSTTEPEAARAGLDPQAQRGRRGANPAEAEAPAWTDRELADPHARADKAGRVRSMFAAIAPSYDLNNRVHSLWRDQAWRRAAVRAAAVEPGQDVLDVACGTGDLTQALAQRTQAATVTGLDFTRAMLDVAEHKRDRRPGTPLARIRYVEGDAMALPFDDASFDALTIAFGIRNVQEPSRALAEFARVLRPGGRLVILEFHRPRNPIVRAFNGFYAGRVMPWTATLLARDRSGAYRYLPKSVGSFMDAEQLRAAVAAAGFDDATVRPLTMGICWLHRGVKA